MQEQDEGIVLTTDNYFSANLISVLTTSSGKTFFNISKSLCTKISPGLIITFFHNKKYYSNVSLISHIINKDYSFTKCITKDIYWSHHILELCYHLSPVGLENTFISSFINFFFYIIFIQDFFEKQVIITKKICIIYFLYKMGVLLEQQLNKILKIIEAVDAFFKDIHNEKNIYVVKKFNKFTCSINNKDLSKTLSNIITTSLNCHMDVRLLKTIRFIY